MALAWARMRAPDVALAEAAIGTGLLGVLLIDSLGLFTRSKSETPPQPRRSRAASILAVGTTLLLAGGLGFAILAMPEAEGLAAAAAEKLGASGVDHPVTAVLLNFRSFDTWLEIGVLLIAMWGLFCAGGREGFAPRATEARPGTVLGGTVQSLLPLVLLVGIYLLWLGKVDSGGAFQAGVVLGAAGILLRLGGLGFPDWLRPWLVRTLLLFGFAFMLLVGLSALFAGAAFLEYPPTLAGPLILAVELAATLSIGFTLYCFFTYLFDLRIHPATASSES
ncbi:MAG: DUF4040 domain-containing protein [Puniceicoccaceae bacterium]|nr:MAG: DUF4040 domain-containing protein [Puniceicoccaceae bacterium]